MPAEHDAATVEELEEIIRSGIRDPKDVHHNACYSLRGEPCDCYYRWSAPSHEALDELVRRAER